METATLTDLLRERSAAETDLLDAVDAMTVDAWGLSAEGYSKHDTWIMGVQDKAYEAGDVEAAVKVVVDALRTIPAAVLADAGEALRHDAALAGHGGLRARIAALSSSAP